MINKEKNFISAVVYINNNEKNVKEFLENLNEVLSNNFLKYEIICVNDYSTDNTLEEIRKVSTNNVSTITVINMSFYQGKESAMSAGIDIAIGDFVYEFDSIIIDYEKDLIMSTYMKALEGYDIVSTSPKNRRRKTSAIFYKIFNKFSNSQYNIDTETFRILSRRVINRINSMSKTIPYRKAIYANCGLKIFRMYYSPIFNRRERFDTKSKKERKRNAIDSLILFTDISYKISIIMSFIMMIITSVVAVYTVYIFISSNPIAGWTTTMLFLTFGFFGIFAIMAIIIKYLSIAVNMIFKRSKYVVESIEKIKEG